MKYLINRLKKISLVIIFCLGSVSCSQTTIDDYSNSQPILDLKEFFNGELKAYGILQNRSGLVTRKFSATIDASWEGNKGILNEKFLFDDGSEEFRIWTLHSHGDGRYTGTAGDVIGEAVGQIKGSVFQWQYKLQVPYQEDEIVVNLNDWLYLVDQDHLINRTQLTKFGFRVGELTLIIEKH